MRLGTLSTPSAGNRLLLHAARTFHKEVICRVARSMQAALPRKRVVTRLALARGTVQPRRTQFVVSPAGLPVNRSNGVTLSVVPTNAWLPTTNHGRGVSPFPLGSGGGGKAACTAPSAAR